MDISESYAELSKHRMYRRASVSCWATIVEDGFRRRVRVKDASAGGLRLSCAGLREGARILVCLEGSTPRAARIAWSQLGEAGCEFAEPLPPELVESIEQAGRLSHLDVDSEPASVLPPWKQ